jgi:ParB family chromosome partitioning protein
MARKPRLGKGLNALMAQQAPVGNTEGAADAGAEGAAASPNEQQTANGAASSPLAGGLGLQQVLVERIEPSPSQAREHFDETALEKLADSIREHGLMQPVLLLPPREEGGNYQLVAGERRWRAARQAGIEEIPAIVQEIDAQQAAEWGLIENLQREDLNPIERARAFQKLMEEHGHAQQEVANRLGLDRATVSNMLRLLSLDESVQQMVSDGVLSGGQARVLAGIQDGERQRELAEAASREGWSVRKLEQVSREAQGNESRKTRQKQARSAQLSDLEEQLSQQLQTRVRIRPGRKKGSGTLSLEFYSLDDFDRLLERLGLRPE